ncbi:MAG: PEP-CTERM sorting domain-containing protein [Aquabacterium sp.]
MSFEFKKVALGLAIAAASAAHADVLVVKAGGATFQGTGTWSASDGWMAALDSLRISASGYGSGTAAFQKDTDGYYTSLTMSAPMQTLTMDFDSLAWQGVGLKGGLTLTAPAIKQLSSGGSLTVTDIAADLQTKTIYATIIGGNGVGTLEHFALWRFTSLIGTTQYSGFGAYTNDLAGMYLTDVGFNKLSQALGLLPQGVMVMEGAKDYGIIHTAFNATLECCDVPPAVPEPGSHALWGVGLALLGVVAARHPKHKHRELT